MIIGCQKALGYTETYKLNSQTVFERPWVFDTFYHPSYSTLIARIGWPGNSGH